jgi:hypothetical protein
MLSMVNKREVSEVMRALAKKRWAKTTKEERSEALRKTVQARWAKEKGGKDAR